MNLSRFLGIFFMPVIGMSLSACDSDQELSSERRADPQKKAPSDTSHTFSDFSALKRKADAGDTQSIIDLVQYYRNKDINGKMDGWLILGNSQYAKDSRGYYEKSIDGGDALIKDILTKEYMNAGMNEGFSKSDRRSYLIKALWTWQRNPPSVQGWGTTSAEIPRNPSLESRGYDRLQDIIIALNNLENE